MKRLYATTDPVEAELLRALLRDAGIESLLDNQGGASYAIGLPVSVSPLGIDVADEDAAEAAEILGRHFSNGAAEGDPDPDAPDPLSPDEDAQFKERVRLGNRRWGSRLAVIYLLPVGLTGIYYLLRGIWPGVWASIGVLAGFIALGWFINAVVKPAAKEKGPAS